jgi:hypothetical protein
LREPSRFFGFSGLVSLGGTHKVNHESRWQDSIQNKGHNGSQECSIGVGGFGHTHHECDVNPSYNNDVHAGALFFKYESLNLYYSNQYI